jgi:hypothetical protein
VAGMTIVAMARPVTSRAKLCTPLRNRMIHIPSRNGLAAFIA